MPGRSPRRPLAVAPDERAPPACAPSVGEPPLPDRVARRDRSCGTAGQLDLVTEALRGAPRTPAPCAGRPRAPDGPAASSARRTPPASGGLAPRGREAEAARASARCPRSIANCSTIRRRPCVPRRRRSSGSRISASSARPRASGIFRRHQQAGHAGDDHLGDGADLGRHHRQLLRHRLHDHVRQAVAVAVARRPGPRGRTDRHGAGRPAPRPASRRRASVTRSPSPSRSARAGELARAWPAAEMLEAPVQLRAAAGPAPRAATSSPFFSTARATQTMRTGRPGSLPSPPALAARRREARRLQPVIDELQVGPRRQRAQMVEVHAAAGDEPARRRDLLALLPIRDRPDVLGVRRDAERQVAQERGVARHRRRACAGSARAASRPRPAARPPAPAPARGAGRGWPWDRAAGRPARPPAGARKRRPQQLPAQSREHPQRLLVEIFRQVADRCPDQPVQLMDAPVGRAAQRHDLDVQAEPLQRQDLLGDEGFRQARIALDQDGDAPRPVRHARPPP